MKRQHYGNKVFDQEKKRWVCVKGEAGDGGKTLQCTECEFTSKWNRNLRRHTERVHMGMKSPVKDEEPKQCPECPYIGKRRRYLQKHMANMHLPKEDEAKLEEL